MNRWVFLVLVLAGCGGSRAPAYRCDAALGPGFIGSDLPMNCEIVARNALLVRSIMEQAAVDFGNSLVQSITIRDQENWVADDGSRTWGVTAWSGATAEIELGHSMWSLNHEFGHVFLLYTTGDSNGSHSKWGSSGQLTRDHEYAAAFEPLPCPGESESHFQDCEATR